MPASRKQATWSNETRRLLAIPCTIRPSPLKPDVEHSSTSLFGGTIGPQEYFSAERIMNAYFVYILTLWYRYISNEQRVTRSLQQTIGLPCPWFQRISLSMICHIR